MSTTTQETPKTKPKPKPKQKPKPESQIGQKIPITNSNFALLKGFADGTFREELGDSEEQYCYCPGMCPFCRSAAGYERRELIWAGPYYTNRRMKDHHQQNRLLFVNCLDCGSSYKMSEVWHIYLDVSIPTR